MGKIYICLQAYNRIELTGSIMIGEACDWFWSIFFPTYFILFIYDQRSLFTLVLYSIGPQHLFVNMIASTATFPSATVNGFKIMVAPSLWVPE